MNLIRERNLSPLSVNMYCVMFSVFFIFLINPLFVFLKRYDGKLPGLNISLVSVILSKSDVKSSRRKPKRFGFYKMASQIYAYKDMGASDNEIAQILLEEEKVIRRGTNGSYSFPSRMGEWEILSIMPNIMSLRAEIEPKLIVVLRAMFPDEEINQPYR